MNRLNFFVLAICIFTWIIWTGLLNSTARAEIFPSEEKIYGISISYGGEAKSDPLWHESESCDWDMSSLHMLYGWRLQHFDLLLEGTAGWIDFERSNGVMAADTTVHMRRDLIHYKRSSLFGRIGVGLGLWTDTPSHGLVSSPPIAIIQYGLGILFPLRNELWWKIETIFKHYSAIGPDSGHNSYVFGIGVEW